MQIPKIEYYFAGVQFGSEVMHRVGGGRKVSPKPPATSSTTAAAAAQNGGGGAGAGGKVINIPIRLDNGEYVKPNRYRWAFLLTPFTYFKRGPHLK